MSLANDNIGYFKCDFGNVLLLGPFKMCDRHVLLSMDDEGGEYELAIGLDNSQKFHRIISISVDE